MDMSNYDITEIVPNEKSKKRKKHESLISRLNNIDNEDFLPNTNISTCNFLPSSLLKPSKSDEKSKKDKDETLHDPDAWFNEMMSYQSPKLSRSAGKNDLFDSAGITGKSKKKKGKKKKKESQLVDFKKEFEPEAALYKNLLMEQTRFTDSLQREYDHIKSTKSSSRGVTKQMTDLIENINGARSLAMQLVDKQVSIKKQAAELNMKQQKEFGANLGESENMAEFASSYLKQMLSERGALIESGTGEAVVNTYTEDELLNELSATLIDNDDSDRTEESELYLKYENRNVEIFVVITNDDIENYEFLAKDENDEEICDYPLPNHTKISINRSTNIATDTYGKKYKIIWN